MKNQIPMNLQYFAEEGGNGGQNTGEANNNQANQNNSNQNNNNQASASIDYDKIQVMIDKGVQQKENAILKSYFQQQGMTEEEAKQAMETFKQQKQSQQPDVTAIQQQLTQAQAAAQQAEIEKQATLEALSLGIDVKTIPYVLKMADLSQITDAEGKLNQEGLKNALNKVLEDIPQLKPAQQQNNTGFQQIGAGENQNNNNSEDALAKIFGNAK